MNFNYFALSVDQLHHSNKTSPTCEDLTIHSSYSYIKLYFYFFYIIYTFRILYFNPSYLSFSHVSIKWGTSLTTRTKLHHHELHLKCNNSTTNAEEVKKWVVLVLVITGIYRLVGFDSSFLTCLIKWNIEDELNAK